MLSCQHCDPSVNGKGAVGVGLRVQVESQKSLQAWKSAGDGGVDWEWDT